MARKDDRGKPITLLSGLVCGLLLASSAYLFRVPHAARIHRWWPDHELVLQRTDLPARWIVHLKNHTTQEMRIFDFWNSWGYYTLRFRWKSRANGNEPTISHGPRTWTINFPSVLSVLSVPAHDSIEIQVDLTDGEWSIPPDVNVENEDYFLKALFEIEPDEETQRLGVFVGRLESPWVRSPSPP